MTVARMTSPSPVKCRAAGRVAAFSLALFAGLGIAGVAYAMPGHADGSGMVAARPAASDGASTRPCSFAMVTTCQSTNPAIRTYLVFSGATAGCTFDISIGWGDSQKTQEVVLASPRDGTDFLAAHAYRYSDRAESFTISVVATVAAGQCGFEPGELFFTLLRCSSSELSGGRWAARFPDSLAMDDWSVNGRR
jgi:hypothetical protein